MKTKRNKIGRKSLSAGKLFSPANSFHRNLGIALFGQQMDSKESEEMLSVVGMFEKGEGYSEGFRAEALRYAHRYFDEIARPRLLNALEKQDPQPFLDFAKAIYAARRIREEGQPLQPFHAKILRFANTKDPGFVPGKIISYTAQALKSELKLPQSVEYIRRECKRVGVLLQPDKVGRPQKSPTIIRSRKS